MYHAFPLSRLLLMTCLCAMPSAAFAQSAFDTLEQASSSSTRSRAHHTGARGERMALEHARGSLSKTSAAKLDVLATPSGKNRYVEAIAECNGFVLLEEYRNSSAHKNDTADYTALELATGERFASTQVNSYSRDDSWCEGGVFILPSRHSTPAAFDTHQKTWHEPEVIFPVGATLGIITRVIPVRREDGPAREFLVRTTPKPGKEDTHYKGVWRPGEGTITLSEHLPWDGVRAARLRDERIEVIGFDIEHYTSTPMFGDGRPTSSTRIVPQIYEVDEAITLRKTLDQYDAISFLPDGYMAMTHGGEAIIVHPDGEEERLELEGCERHFHPKLTSLGTLNPSALYMCRTAYDDASDHATYRFAYWTPQETTTWTDTWHGQVGGAPSGTVVQSLVIQPPGIDGDRTHIWFDTRTGTIWEGKARYGLLFSDRVTRRATLFATDAPHKAEEIDKRKRINLYAVDLDAGRETLLHTYTDCPGELSVSEAAGEYIAVHCLTNDQPEKFRFEQHWSEVIDLRNGVRWRAPKSRSIRKVFENGSFVVSDVARGDNILYKASRKLWLGRLDP